MLVFPIEKVSGREGDVPTHSWPKNTKLFLKWSLQKEPYAAQSFLYVFRNLD
jgi:hypothetical protein